MSTICNSYQKRLHWKTLSSKGEENTGEINTVPDETLTIRQLLERYVKGLPVAQSERQPTYDEENDMPDISTMDLTEIDDYIDELKQRQATSKRNLKLIENEKKRRETPPPPQTE